jgi:uncharacterized protein
VPHFEKMLYDNAQLALLYARAWLVTRNERLRHVAVDTLEYMLRELRDPAGGFSSSQDADSEGVEGKYYTWTWEELVDSVGPEAAEAFGARPEGNWEGTNVLRAPHGEPDVAAAREVLLRARGERVPPVTDDKVLTAWNALAIRAFAEAGRIFEEPRYVDAARDAAVFVRDHLHDGTGRLLRSWRAGVAGVPAFADDHALLAGAYLTLYEITTDVAWFSAARELCDRLIELFLDPDRGGFFQTGSDTDPLVVRPKDLDDNAVPSGNSAAAEALLRIAMFTGETSYEEAAGSALRLVRDVMATAPTGFGHALSALDLFLGPSYEVAIVGDPGSEATRALVDEVIGRRWLPNVVLAVCSPDDRSAQRAVALLRDRPQVDGKSTAYVCERFVCLAPVTSPSELASALAD